MDQYSRSRYFIEAIDRGLAVLRLFNMENATLSLAEIARRSNNVPSTALRQVQTLIDLGYLEFLPESGRYQPSLSALKVGHEALVTSPVYNLALPILQRLRRETNQAVSVATLIDSNIVVVESVAGADALPIELRPGFSFPAYATAMGKAVLATHSMGGNGRELYSPHLTKVGPNTITTSKDIKAEMESVRKSGFATEDEELFAGIRAIGAAVSTSGLAEDAIGISVDAARFTVDELRREFAPLLVGAAAELAVKLRSA